ncbi:hypothetical protein BVRB_6g144860 [Beta vulgaris subsp. vulgaris]|nr:hypothetical protein BVRB_6g144860 [Beta vulgaris subsp. vulgaris]
MFLSPVSSRRSPEWTSRQIRRRFFWNACVGKRTKEVSEWEKEVTVAVIKGRANVDDDEDDDECDDEEEEEIELKVEKEKEKEQKQTEKIEKEKEKKNEKLATEKQKAKDKGKKVVEREELVKPVARVTRTSQRVRNLKVLNSPSHDEEESVDDEVSVIAKEVYDACIPPSREQSPAPMDTIPPTTSSPPKSTAPPPFAPQNTPIPPPTQSPPFPIPKEKKPANVPILEEQPAVPDLKEQSAAQNAPNTSPSSSQNPTIGATYTLAHARRLDYLFTLVMGHSKAMMEFANEAKGVNGVLLAFKRRGRVREKREKREGETEA